jgi:hypothetical protein
VTTERTHAVESAAVAVRPAGQPCDLHHHARYREPKTERAWRGVRIDRVVQTESRDAGRSVPDRLTAALSYHQQSNFDVRPGEEGPAMLLPSFARRPRGVARPALRSTKGTAGGRRTETWGRDPAVVRRRRAVAIGRPIFFGRLRKAFRAASSSRVLTCGRVANSFFLS